MPRHLAVALANQRTVKNNADLFAYGYAYVNGLDCPGDHLSRRVRLLRAGFTSEELTRAIAETTQPRRP